MIPQAHIVEWRSTAPWVADAQVEQDLLISRALVALFSNKLIANTLAAYQDVHKQDSGFPAFAGTDMPE